MEKLSFPFCTKIPFSKLEIELIEIDLFQFHSITHMITINIPEGRKKKTRKKVATFSSHKISIPPKQPPPSALRQIINK